MKQEIGFEIVKELGELSPASKGWSKQINLLRWNDGEAKLDIRSWTADHEKMSKGIALTIPEAQMLVTILQKFFTDQEA